MRVQVNLFEKFLLFSRFYFVFLFVYTNFANRKIYKILNMNYEEVIENRNSKLLQEAVLPIGTMYKQLVDKKYQNVVRIRQEIVNDIVVNGDLSYEYNVQCSLNNRHLLHYQTIIDDNQQIKGLLVEQGSYISVDELLKTNPAIVAAPDFIG